MGPPALGAGVLELQKFSLLILSVYKKGGLPFLSMVSPGVVLFTPLLYMIGYKQFVIVHLFLVTSPGQRRYVMLTLVERHLVACY